MGDGTGFGRLVRRPTLSTILEYLHPAVSLGGLGRLTVEVERFLRHM